MSPMKNFLATFTSGEGLEELAIVCTLPYHNATKFHFPFLRELALGSYTHTWSLKHLHMGSGGGKGGTSPSLENQKLEKRSKNKKK